LKTILTRSRERGQVYAGKVLATLTYTTVAVFAMGIVGLVAASIAWGLGPLTSLSGTPVSAGQGLELLAASLAVYVLPMAGIASFGVLLSTVTRNSAASVVGTLMFALLMQLIGVLPGTESIRPYLLGTQFEAWHGFLRRPTDWAPIVRAVWLCALYVAVPLFAGYLVFLRRDVAQGEARLCRPACSSHEPVADVESDHELLAEHCPGGRVGEGCGADHDPVGAGLEERPCVLEAADAARGLEPRRDRSDRADEL